MDQDIRHRMQRRDYTREVINPRLPAPPPRPEPPKKNSNKWLKLVFISLARLAVVALIIGAGFLAWRHFTDKASPIPKDITKSVSYQLYYPSPLPKGYSLDKSSVKVAGGIVFYTVRDKDNVKPINISIQPAPSGFDPAQHLDPSIKPINIPIGLLYDDSSDSAIKYIIIPKSGGELIFINSQNTNNPALRDLVNGLQPISH